MSAVVIEDSVDLASLCSRRTDMSIFDRLGVKTFINGRGTHTRFGGAPMHSRVTDAMKEASQYSVNLFELHDVLSDRLAEMTRNEAAAITCGAAAGISLSVAACMTEGDPEKMKKFPNVEGMKSEVILQRATRFDEDFSIRLTGARQLELGTDFEASTEGLEKAISPKTAAIFTTHWEGEGILPLEKLVTIGQARNVPVIVDLADAVPPRRNFWRYTRELGADLAIFSGGKRIQGPQTSGLVVGKRVLVDAIKAQSCPNCLLGRPMKVSKEQMVGLFTAIEILMSSNEVAYSNILEERASIILESINKFMYIDARHVGDELLVKIDEQSSPVSCEGLVHRLKNGDPSIEVGVWGNIVINLSTLREYEAELIGQRIVAELVASE